MRAHRLLIPLAAFLAILPMLLTGPSCGHDFDFHLLNWLEANTQLTHLQYPHWAYTPAYNAGEPRFIFYPPLSWLLGAALTQLLPFHYVPIAFTWLCLTLSGFTLHRFARDYAPPAAATVASVLYLLNPYMLFTAYERTAYAELLAAAFIPLLFAGILRPRPTIPAMAIPLALLWLTNAPAAVMSSYALALLALVRLALLIRNSRKVSPPSPSSLFPLPFFNTTLDATLLGLALAAFYILPAAYERKYVAIAMLNIPGMAPADNTLFHHMALVSGVTPDDALAHDIVLHTASLIAILLLTATAATLLLAWRKPATPYSLLPTPCRYPVDGLLLPATVLNLVIAFLLTPISLPIWTHTPQLAFLQFPWRLLALLTPILALATGLCLGKVGPRLYALVPALLLLIPISWHFFQQPCDTPDTPEARFALYHSPLGTEPTDEYTPRNADNDALHPEASEDPAPADNPATPETTDPPYWLLPPATPIDFPPPPSATPGPAPGHLTLTGPGTLILNRRQYPLWQITLNHHLVSSEPRRQDGLIAIPLRPGRNTIDLTLRQTPDELLGLILSVLAAIILLALRIRHPVHSSSSA